MNDTTIPTESAAQPGATNANSPASQSVQASTSQGAQDVPEWFKPYAQKLDAAEKVSRVKQSEADRATAAANRKSRQEIDALVAKVSRLQNLDEAQAASLRDRMVYEEIQERMFAGDGQATANPASQGSGAGGAASLDELTILKSFNLKEDDETLEVMREADGDPMRLIAGFNALALRRASTPQPSLAAVPVPAGGSVVPPVSLQESYNRESANLRGNDLIELKMQYRKKGLDIN